MSKVGKWESGKVYGLVARIGTNKSYISRVETGRIEPKVSTFYRIIAALGLTVEPTLNTAPS